MIAFTLFDWHMINLVSPFVGLLASGYVFFSYKTCTSRKAISTAVCLSIMLWLMLLWADWGSVVFEASYQSMWARVLLLMISVLITYELRRHTGINAILKSKNKMLLTENELLIEHVKFLHAHSDKKED
jgi:hypothetical protein